MPAMTLVSEAIPTLSLLLLVGKVETDSIGQRHIRRQHKLQHQLRIVECNLWCQVFVDRPKGKANRIRPVVVRGGGWCIRSYCRPPMRPDSIVNAPKSRGGNKTDLP